MPTLMLAILAVAVTGAAPAPAPPSNQVSPLTVQALPKDAPPAEATVSVGADDFLGAQDVSIWPAGAKAAGIGGKVTLNCFVDVHGLAETCRVAYEVPAGRGFGSAALALRPNFKLKPRQGPDGPIDGRMNIAIEFKPTETSSNLTALQAANVPPDGGDHMANLGNHEINARDLVVYNNPLAMRRVTLTDQPIWVQAPSFQDLAAAYPAQGGGVEGYVVAHCRMEKTGALARCAVAKELPVGHGFGQAALALAPQFRVSPETIALAPRGAPVEVDVPIRFPPPAEARDRTVRAPIWLARADPQSLLAEFPRQVAATKPSPGAVVRCQVAADGSLSGCATELTSPDGLDFDDAAVKLASRLKMNLWSAEAGPVQGGVVHIPVRLDTAGGG